MVYPFDSTESQPTNELIQCDLLMTGENKVVKNDQVADFHLQGINTGITSRRIVSRTFKDLTFNSVVRLQP